MHSWLQGNYSWFTLKIYKNWLSSLWSTAKRNHSNYERSLRSIMSHLGQRIKIIWGGFIEKQNTLRHNWNLFRSPWFRTILYKASLTVLSGQSWVDTSWERGHFWYSTGISVWCLCLLSGRIFYVWGLHCVPLCVADTYVRFKIYKVRL